MELPWRSCGARGWSQEELALKTQLSQRHVSFLETGRSQSLRSAAAPQRAGSLDGQFRNRHSRDVASPQDRSLA
ncbi:MAG: helix-turn-helix transcriptional regulator [Erythrobacter sp.]|nr:helix-turn-helix transcriptional regulator [Erythrobacter sp.]